MTTLRSTVSTASETLFDLPRPERFKKSGRVRQPSVRLLRVLVVDDDRDMADTTCMMLRLWGHNVRSAYGGATGLLLASDILPDVILLDVAMPAVTGCDVAQKLRGLPRFNRTRIVAMSGYVDEIHRQEFLQAGFDDLLPKPLELEKLEQLLEWERIRAQSPRISARVRGYTTTEARPRREAPCVC